MDDDARFMARTPAGEPYELAICTRLMRKAREAVRNPDGAEDARVGFSWLALLPTPLYLLYRKQYLAAGCWIAVSFGADFLSKSFDGGGMLFFLASLVFGMAFYCAVPRQRRARDGPRVRTGRDERAGGARLRAALRRHQLRGRGRRFRSGVRARRGGGAGRHLSARRARRPLRRVGAATLHSAQNVSRETLCRKIFALLQIAAACRLEEGYTLLWDSMFEHDRR